MNGTAFLYIDPDFTGTGGHHVRMGHLLQEGTKGAGVRMYHAVRRTVSPTDAARFNVIPTFYGSAALDRVPNVRRVLDDFYEQLNSLIRSCIDRGVRDCTIFMYTAHPLHIPVIAYVAAAHRSRIRIRAYPSLFHACGAAPEHTDRDEQRWVRSEAAVLTELCDPYGAVTVCTDSSRIRHLYEPYVLRPIHLLPLPLWGGERTPNPSKAAYASRPIAIGYVGHTLRRTGYYRLHEIYRRMRETDVFASVWFVVKHTPHGRSNRIEPRLVQETDRITHLSGFLSDAAYEDLFDQLDVVLLPYSRREFPVQTSGILAEAIGRGKVVVVPADTWLSDQLELFGGGETFVSGDVDSLVRALAKIVRRYDMYKEKAMRTVASFRATHSVDNLLSVLEVGNMPHSPKQRPSVVRHRAPVIPGEKFFRMHLGLVAQVFVRGRMVEDVSRELEAMYDSWSWRATAPVRALRGRR